MRAEDDVVLDRETDVVSLIRLAVADRIGSERYEIWLAETDIQFSDNELRIGSAKQFQLEWVRANFSDELRTACKQITGCDVDLLFRIDTSLARPESSSAQSAKGTSSRSEDRQDDSSDRQNYRSKRRFASLSTFVVGEANRVAHMSAKMVSKQLGSITPLFVYGPTGVGKSHLLEGLWSTIRRQGRRRCIYLTAEQFTSYFLESLHGRGLPNFRRRYRGLDLLIIEDVQFFAGKQATVSELLHTIDSLSRDGRQVVFSADRPPNELNQLGPELTNRLCGGLVVNMQPPDITMRLEILKRLAELRSVDAPDDVLHMIAQRLPDDVRKLHGALHRLAATSAALQQPITPLLARTALEEVFRSSTRHVQLGDIERVVCDSFGVEPKTLRSSCRTRNVSHPRMLAMWLARKYTRAGLAEIGEFFGRRSHSTVVSAEKKVNTWQNQGHVLRMASGDLNARDAIRQIEAKLHAG